MNTQEYKYLFAFEKINWNCIANAKDILSYGNENIKLKIKKNRKYKPTLMFLQLCSESEQILFFCIEATAFCDFIMYGEYNEF